MVSSSGADEFAACSLALGPTVSRRMLAAARMAANLVADELEDWDSDSDSQDDGAESSEGNFSGSWGSHSASWTAPSPGADLGPLAPRPPRAHGLSGHQVGAANAGARVGLGAHEGAGARHQGAYQGAHEGAHPREGACDRAGPAEEEVQSAPRRRKVWGGAASEAASMCAPKALRAPDRRLPWPSGAPPQGGFHQGGAYSGGGSFQLGAEGEGGFLGAVPRDFLAPHLRPDLWGPQEGGGMAVVGRGGVLGRRGGKGRAWDFSRLLESCGGARGDGLLLQRAMELGEALERSDLALFRDKFRWLSQFANPQGDAIVRLLHYLLHGLLLRCTGMGYASFNSPSSRPAEVADKAQMWYFKHFPTTEHFHALTMAAACALLSDKPRIHIIEFGYFMVSQWPVFFRVLAKKRRLQEEAREGGGAAPGPEGRGRPPIKLRLTLIGITRLISPGRQDLGQIGGQQQQLAMWLKVSAVSAGIDLELEIINLDRQNLPQLTLRVVPRPGDALLVFAGLEFDYLLDSSVLEYGVRETLIEWVSSMDPLALMLLGVDVDCNDLPMLERMYNLIGHQLPLFLMHDQMVAHHGGAEHRNLFEELFMGRGTVNNLACEGAERLLRSQSLQRWAKHMEAAGLAPGRLYGLDMAYSMLKNYAPGYGMQVEHGSVRVTWRGNSVLCFSSWVPKSQAQ